MGIVILIVAAFVGSFVYYQIESRFIRFGTLSGIIGAKIGLWITCTIVSFYAVSYIIALLGNLAKGIFPYVLIVVFIIGAAISIYEFYKLIIESKDLFAKLFPRRAVRKESTKEYDPEAMYGRKGEVNPESKTDEPQLLCLSCGNIISKEDSFCAFCGTRIDIKTTK